MHAGCDFRSDGGLGGWSGMFTVWLPAVLDVGGAVLAGMKR